MNGFKKNKIVLLFLVVLLISSFTWNFSNIEKAIPENPIRSVDTVPNKLLFTSFKGKEEIESTNGEAIKKDIDIVASNPIEKNNDNKHKLEEKEEEKPKEKDEDQPKEQEQEQTKEPDEEKAKEQEQAKEPDDIKSEAAENKEEQAAKFDEIKEEKSKPAKENERDSTEKENNPNKQSQEAADKLNEGDQENSKAEDTEPSQQLPDSTEPIVDPEVEDIVEIVEGNQDENPYFTTTISNEETVSDAFYEFSIIQKNPDIKALSTSVLVNNQEVSSFNGSITLGEGSNQIDIIVIYDDKNQTKVHRKYIVYFAKNDLVITSSLKDGAKTSVPTIQFEATAHYNDVSVAVEAKFNEMKLVEGADGLYKVHLNEGENTIILNAAHNGINKQQEIKVVYEKKISKIVFETDLKNQQTTNAEITFYAAASVEGQDIDLIATLNGEKLRERNHYFSDLLKEGKNIITLSATTPDDTHEESYIIYYQPEIVTNNPEKVPDDEAGPIIKTDLVNNAQVSGTKKNFNVWATTAEGKRIQASGVTVHNNNKAVSVIWDDSVKTSYRLNLAQGKNNVVIKAWDAEGRISTKTLTIYAKNIEKNDSIGTATVSIDASVVGLGIIVPPTKIELYEGVNGAYTVDQFLRKHGFTYENTGTLDSSFYLASIAKPGMAKNLKIPEDMIKKINESTVTFDPTNFSPDSLGEFDLTSGSGWMYYVNGDAPNYGFSDAVFLDGDIIEYKFTLLYGAEIR